MAKPELGTKRLCPSCGTKYYDLHRDPIVCPSCRTVFVGATHQKAPERPTAPAGVETAVAEPVEREEGVVSLEETEDDAEADLGPDVDEEVVAPPDEDVEVEAEIATEDEDTFLEDEEEEGDDVSGLLDVEAENEEER